MRRRAFLAVPLALGAGSRLAPAVEVPDDLRITRIVALEITSRRNKVAGKNARLDVHGDTAKDRIVRVLTDQGLEGLGDCRMGEAQARELLGQNPFAFLSGDPPRFGGPIGPGTMPLWDLLGKATRQPVFKLLGGAGLEAVPVYDGSIYFADLLPQYADRWQRRFREEIELARSLGHEAVKVKIGRGNRWMPRTEGDRRDREVVRLIREHAGPDLLIGVDANNGYDRPGAQRLFDEIGDLNIAFAEEMFEENVEDCLAFKEFLQKRGWKTLVADGETQGDIEVFRPFAAAQAIDIYQADMSRFGFEGILDEARMVQPHSLQIAPHNWGHLVAFYMQLHVGRAVPNFYRAEHDPLSTDALVAEAYTIRDGRATVPDAPGCGLRIREEALARDAKILYDLKA